MELERPRRAAACTTSDILVCFSSGLPKSSAMKGCSKSSVSAMFPAARVNKKKGSDTENPEPCSPKVTCIGQVRVKTKKHGKKMKMNMRAYRARRSQGLGHQSMHHKQRREGEGCLHLQLQDRKQRWVHLPLTICDALRAFGSELNCFAHCIRSCFSKSKVTESKENCRRFSCGGFVCRWRVDLHQEQLVVGEQRKEEEDNDRRSIFDDMDFSNEESNNLNENENGGEEDDVVARSSICIPPKNALLLMRCRSDPLKMSALANKFWESPPKSKEDCIEHVEDKPAEVVTARTIRRSSSCSCSRVRHELIIAMDEEQQQLQEKEEEVLQVNYEEPKQVAGELSFNDNEEDEVKDLDEEATAPLDPAQPSANEQSEQDIQPKVLEESHELEQTSSEQQPLEKSREEEDESALPECLLLMMCEPKLSMEVSKETWICSTDFIRWLPERHRQHHLKKINPNPTNPRDEANNKNNKTACNAPPPPLPARIPAQKQNQSFQPPRSSCSFPIGGRVSTAVGAKDKNSENAAADEPLVLTRCRSEPMRSATAKLAAAPDLPCFRKNRKIEPHRPPTRGGC